MKKVIPFFLIYVIINRSGNVQKSVWSDGQPVDAMLTEIQKSNPDMTWQVVDKRAYDAIPDPVRADDSAKQAEIRQATLDARNTGFTTDQRLEALIKATLP